MHSKDTALAPPPAPQPLDVTAPPGPNVQKSDVLDTFALVYLDDILVFSSSDEEHERHLEVILSRLREHQLYARASKCAFFQERIDFLGHIVSAKGVEVDDRKIGLVQEWPTPTNVHELRSFMGLANFFRRFVRRFAHIAAPLHALTSKNVQWSWAEEHAEVFEALEQALSRAPVVVPPNPHLTYVVYTDASDRHIGAMLTQDHGQGPQVVAFESRSLSQAERGWSTQDKEMAAIVHACHTWRHHLHGSQVEFVVNTDHASMQWFFTCKEPSQRHQRWAQKLGEFKFTISYQPGKLNVVADALSRRPTTATLAAMHSLNATTTSCVVPAPGLLQAIREGYEQDPATRAIIEEIEQRRPSRFQLVDGLLYDPLDRLYVPDNGPLREQLLIEHHDPPVAGHQGANRTLESLKRRYYWPRMDDMRDRDGTTVEVYAVESLLDRKVVKGRTSYYVKWLGYDDERDHTWEPIDSLLRGGNAPAGGQAPVATHTAAASAASPTAAAAPAAVLLATAARRQCTPSTRPRYNTRFQRRKQQ
ncbi:hypothetical protein ABPG75_008487 [Micractinium tetrahymenae]